MLQIIVPAVTYEEVWDESTNEFIPIMPKKERRLWLEHSLISISKWESKWCKPFFAKTDKSYDEIVDYIRCMTITKNVDSEVYSRLSEENISQVNEYIESPMTATTFSNSNTDHRGRRRTITSELIYCWMTQLNIPPEYQKWHINRLLTLIEVCKRENTPPTKSNKKDTIKSYAALNAARKKKYNTKG